jgi:hypothetical protein
MKYLTFRHLQKIMAQSFTDEQLDHPVTVKFDTFKYVDKGDLILTLKMGVDDKMRFVEVYPD